MLLLRQGRVYVISKPRECDTIHITQSSADELRNFRTAYVVLKAAILEVRGVGCAFIVEY